MSNYDSNGAVESESYCMPSWNKRNVDSMTKDMGYHNMSDMANTPKPPVAMKAAKSNPQMGPQAGKQAK